MEKLSVKEQARIRKALYEATEHMFFDLGYVVEPISEGQLIDLNNGHYAKCIISICDSSKFSLEATRAKYEEKLAKAAEKAEQKAQAALKKLHEQKEKN